MYLSKKSVKTFALSAVVVSVLTACHSSKKSPQPDPVTPDPQPTPTSLPVKVSDGYLKGATVFLDLNRNNTLDSGEPSGVTGDGGAVTLDTTNVENPETFPIVAIATVENTTDEDTGTAVATNFSLSAPAGTPNVNPITTLIQTRIAAAVADGNTLTVDEAATQVLTQLGLTNATIAQLLGDYLSDKDTNDLSKQLHALARSIVQLLPENATDLAETLSGEEQGLADLAQAINEAIAQGGDPDAITVVVSDDGINVQIPEVDQAKAFIADFRTWATKIEDEITTPADNFGDKADAALMVVEADIDSLMSTATDVMMVIEERMMGESLNQLSINDFPQADQTGTVNIVNDIEVTDTKMVGKIELDLMFGKERVQLVVDIDSGPDENSTYSSGTAKASGTLSNEKAKVAISDLDVEITGVMLATDTTPEDLSKAVVSMKATAKAQSLTTDAGLLEAHIALGAKAAKHASSGEIGVIPTKLTVNGKFGSGDEAFDAQLTITSTGDVTLNEQGEIMETADNWLDATAMLSLDVELNDFSGATIDLKVTRKSLDDGLVELDLTYGESKVSLTANTADEKGMLKVTDNAGVMMVLQTLDVKDGDKVGEILLGVKPIASITLVNNIHKINYIDGSFATLF